MTAGDIDLWEFNEGFAAIAMAFARRLNLPEDRMNVNGGGIAMGNAMGATGVNLIGTLLDELERRDLATGLIAASGATGIGGALAVERSAGRGSPLPASSARAGAQSPCIPARSGRRQDRKTAGKGRGWGVRLSLGG